MSKTTTNDPFAAFTENLFKVDNTAGTMLIDVNKALIASGERAFAVQRDAAGEFNSELEKLVKIKDPSELPAGQMQYANAMGKIAMTVAGEMFDIQRELQKELAEIMAGAFTSATQSTAKAAERTAKAAAKSA